MTVQTTATTRHPERSEGSAFFDRLRIAAERKNTLLCIGLDTEPDRLPASLRGGDAIHGIVEFNKRIVDATHDLAAAYKPNLAFYEALGPAGMEALLRTRELIPPDVPVIGDAKRGDIDNTMRRYATALLDVYRFDCVTISPYLGRDAIEPVTSYLDRGVYLLCRTSNPGSGEIADLEVRSEDGRARPLYLVIAERVKSWNSNGNLGLVVGATYPHELARVREVAPDLPILLPGVGAQGGLLEESVVAGVDGQRGGLLVNASRQVLYASANDDFPAAARQAAQGLRDRINRARGT